MYISFVFFTFTSDIILLSYQYQLTSVYHCVLSGMLACVWGLDHMRTRERNASVITGFNVQSHLTSRGLSQLSAFF